MIQVWIVRSIGAAVLCLSSLGCDGSEPEAEVSAALPFEERLIHAEQLLNYGKVDSAEQLAVMITSDAPEDWRGHDLLARVHMQRALSHEDAGLIDLSLERLRSAVQSYSSATQHGPSHSGLWRSAGDAAQMAGAPERALEWYRKALASDPDDVRILLRIAQLQFDAAPDESRQLLEHAVRIDPLVPESHASLALLDAQQGDAASARTGIARAIDLDGSNSQLRVVQSRVYRVLGEYAHGLEILLSLPEIEQTRLPATEELAACWSGLGRQDRVADVWAACFMANAYRTDAWRLAIQAGKACLATGERPRAASFFRQAEMLAAPKEALDAARSGAQSP
ncbi:MAG: hypothetical protein GY876_01945 [Planctomycetes bacterium]|nr:hypothetical protein [Planctomycetota bacterium]